MIITCEACHKRYLLEAPISPQGCAVRCAACQHQWVYYPDPSESDLSGSDSSGSDPLEPELLKFNQRELATPESNQPPSPPSAASPAQQAFKLGEAGTPLDNPFLFKEPSPLSRVSFKGWFLYLFTLIACLLSLVTWREEIVTLYPKALKIYHLMGIKVEPLGVGLRINNLHTQILDPRNPSGLTLYGSISNPTTQRKRVPLLLISYKSPECTATSAKGCRKLVRSHRLSKEYLNPGENFNFIATALPTPMAGMVGEVTFGL